VLCFAKLTLTLGPRTAYSVFATTDTRTASSLINTLVECLAVAMGMRFAERLGCSVWRGTLELFSLILNRWITYYVNIPAAWKGVPKIFYVVAAYFSGIKKFCDISQIRSLFTIHSTKYALGSHVMSRCVFPEPLVPLLPQPLTYISPRPFTSSIY
jgi:hypothetical protein